MLFERLADFIMKRAKIIIVVWIVALLIATPFLLRYNSVLQFDMDKMKSSTPLESIQGQEILSSSEFNTGVSMNAGTIIIMEAYDSVAEDVAPVIFKNLDVHSEHLNEPVPGFAEIDGSHTNLLDACYREICH